jgi:uncharacterized membrane protein YvlD (DUF360 family)
MIGRGIVVAAVTAVSLWILASILPGFAIDEPAQALLAGLAVGVINAFIWPALSIVVVPISVLTLGLGAIVLDAIVAWWFLDLLPGVRVESFWDALIIAVWLAATTTLVTTLLSIDDDAWFDQQVARRARKKAKDGTVTDIPGVVFVQIDGLAKVVLERALRSGDAPTMHRWIREGTHKLAGWETGWSSQTGVSQCGILHGSTANMPAFRWLDKTTSAIVVSNHPKWAAVIERAHSDGNGLLAHNGSSYNNLFSGDAERAVLTMSGAARRKEGRIGAGYTNYFSRPQQAARTMLSVLVDVSRERRAALQQRRREVDPRVHRSWHYAGLRAFTTVVSRDVSVQGVINDMCEGRAAIYVDMLGYDEVAHHSGPERADTLAVLRDIDRQLARIQRATRWVARPYRIVVLADHGQTQGATFSQRTGETFAEFVSRLCGVAASSDEDVDEGKTESTAWLREAAPNEPSEKVVAADLPVVLASGCLGLISLPGPGRLTREEITQRYPKLIDGLVNHPLIGFVLVRTATGGSVVLSADGCRDLETGDVTGVDPIEPYGPSAIDQIRETDGYGTAADIMLNSIYDADLDEVAAFEELVGSHGGLGGPQTRPFLLYPSDLTLPEEPIRGAPALHRVLKGWLADLGQPVKTPWRARVAQHAPEATEPARAAAEQS